MNTTLRLLHFAIAVMVAATAHASDGTIEINDAKIMANGGYPYTISQPGSYRLTSNLAPPDKDTHGIVIAASDVALDLNGFAIVGPNDCSISGTFPNKTMVCTQVGVGEGIRATGDRVRVFNGDIVRSGYDCVVLFGRGSQIENVSVGHCGHHGVMFSGSVANGVARHVYAHHCYNTGISVVGTLEESVAESNNRSGIYVDGTAANNAALDNLQSGITGYGVFTGNYSAGNQVHGMILSFANAVGNAVIANGGVGLMKGPASSVAFSQNIFQGNSGGATAAAPVSVPANSNLCDGSPC